LIRANFNWTILVLALLLSVLSFVYLLAASRKSQPAERFEPRHGVMVVTGGLLVFGLGYAVFLSTTEVIFSATGIGNRVALPSTLGVALAYAGVFSWFSGLLPRDRGAPVFSALVAVASFSAVLVVDTLSTFWAAAYQQERRTVSDIRAALPDLQSDSTVLLYGSCPYIGPAIVFESYWDLAGALQLQYGDSSLKADVITPNAQLDANGVTTIIYGDTVRHYNDSNQLLAFDARDQSAHPLTNRGDAQRYLAGALEPSACPPGRAGYGAPVLPSLLTPYR
jgi:hypothetical protein